MNRKEFLNSSLDVIEESEADMFARYSGFAENLFHKLFQTHPYARKSFRFFRYKHGTDDVWAIYKTMRSEFGVQLDPDIEVICIWDSSWHDEIGCWIPNPVEYAIHTISERYLTNDKARLNKP